MTGLGGMIGDRLVVTVYIVRYPGSAHAEALGNSMFAALCADHAVPSSRSLGIEVRFRTSTPSGDVPGPVPFGHAQHTAVFVLADDLLVVDRAWRSYVEGLAGSAGPADLVVPVAITAVGNLPPGLGQHQAIRLAEVPEAEQETVLLNRVMHDLCRLLDPRAAKVKVFLSHARQDGIPITTTVGRYLREVAGLDDFLDTADVPDGTRFAEFLTESAGSLPALLAIHTDAYASREWCRLEVLEAKRHHVPIVVLSAVNVSETRSFPYIGNTPVVRWCDDETSLRQVVRALLSEVLWHRYFPRRVEVLCEQYGLHPGRQVSTHPPELVTMLTYRAEMTAARAAVGRYLYPDPPLGTEELQLLAQLDPDIIPVTPITLQAQ